MKINLLNASIKNIYIHKVGNKTLDEDCFFSKKEYHLDDSLKILLSHYFFSSFNSEKLYQLNHDIHLELNEVYSCVNKIFNNIENLKEQSINLAKHLYNMSTHPKIKGGEFYIVYFKDCVLDDKKLDAIGLFKSENKDTFLEIEQANDGFDIESKQGININKLDKGCIILNKLEESGYIVSIIDNTNKGNEAQYWKDDFLGVSVLNNQFYQTNQFLKITKQFLTQNLSKELDISKTDQIDFLNRSINYFKNNDAFDKQEFEGQVFENNNIIEFFQEFDQNYRQKNEVHLPDNFEISTEAVKKQARTFKNVLKLDKNFHIYIHGNRDLIEQGIDEKGRKYYKIYYEEET